MATVEGVSTKRINDGNTVTYNFRQTEDIGKYVNYVMNGNEKEKPLYSSSNGFINSQTDADIISDEVAKEQSLYRKDSGIRIRGENVIINMDELLENELNDVLVENIADMFSSYYMGLGFQNAYGVYVKDDCYLIKYAINPVSFADGSKYKHNDMDIRDREECCINTIVADAVERDIPFDQRFDFDTLEYSHIICKTPQNN